jgi:hypothetical protein
VHVVADGHEMALICPIPSGPFSVVQFFPPLVVTTTSPVSTAMQSLLVAQEMAWRPPGVGAYVFSTCQDPTGPAAEAGEMPTVEIVTTASPVTVSTQKTL